MICEHCNTHEATSKKRPLCKLCYYELHKANMLDKYPLLPNDEFINSLINKYGESIVDDLMNIVNSSLIELSKKYGFTREYARQIFKKVFNVDYTVIVREKAAKKREREDILKALKKDPRNKLKNFKDNSYAYKGAIGEEKVLNILIGLGYDVKPYMDGTTFDLVVNGYNVDVKTSSIPVATSSKCKTKMFRFSVSKKQRLGDFIICYACSINKFFVIPAKEIKGQFTYIQKNRYLNGF